MRIEDIDPPREVPGASDTILSQLEQHGLMWDEDVIYQSANLDKYHSIIQQLHDQDWTYHCQCNRKRLSDLHGVYDGKCRDLRLGDDDTALRLNIKKTPGVSQSKIETISFTDQVMADFSQHIAQDIGDFILRRRDGLVSYHVAVVVDDQEQGINEVLRGADLLDSTPKQILLQQCLGYRTPAYIHIPLVVNREGQKFSKQTHAPALVQGQENKNLWFALHWLQQNPPPELQNEDIEEIVYWATTNWDLSRIPPSISGMLAPEN